MNDMTKAVICVVASIVFACLGILLLAYANS